MDESITVERVRHGLVVGRLGEDRDAVSLAESLPPQRERTVVVVGAGAVDAMTRLDPWLVADIAEKAGGDLCVVAPDFGAMGDDGQLPPARLLADRLGVEVAAADGAPVGLADGSFFVSGDTAGWVSFRPGGRRTHVGARYPAPRWQDDIQTTMDGHVVEVPVGLWVRLPRAPRRPDDPMWRQAPDRDRMYVVLGAPGERPPAATDVVKVLRGLPDEGRDRAVLACYGANGFAGTTVRAVAERLGTPIRVAHGVPSDDGPVHVEETGTAAWRPFALESVYPPSGAPVLDRWVAPMPGLGMAEPGSYRLADGWRVDVLAGGLAVRPESMPPNPAWAAETGPTADLILAADGPVPAAVVSAIDGLVRALPAAARERLRVVPVSRHAAAAASTLEAADRVRLPAGPAVSPSGATATGRRVNGKAPTSGRRDKTTQRPAAQRRGSYGRPLPQPRKTAEPGAHRPHASVPPRLAHPHVNGHPTPHAASRAPRPARAASQAGQPLHPHLPGAHAPAAVPARAHRTGPHDPAPRLALPAAWVSVVESPGGPLTGAVVVTAQGRVLPATPALAAPVKRERSGGVAAKFVARLEQPSPDKAAAPVAVPVAAGSATRGGPAADPAAAPVAVGSAPSRTQPDRTATVADRSPGTSTSDSALGSVVSLLPGRAQPVAQPTRQASEGTQPADEAPAAQAGPPPSVLPVGQAGPAGRPGTPSHGQPAAQFAGPPGAQLAGSVELVGRPDVRFGQPSVELAGQASVPAAVPNAVPHALPQPEAAAQRIIEVPADVRSTAQQRSGMRAKLGSRYDVAARAVARLLSERPGLRTGDRDQSALLTELAVVRVFAEDPAGGYDPDFFVCLACGLRRLPTARAVVVRGLPAGTDLQADAMLQLRVPVLAAPALPARQVGPVEALIWTTTGRRLDGLLDDLVDGGDNEDDDPDSQESESQQAHGVVLSGHTKLRVLGVESGRFLLAEAGAPREAALNRLRAAASSRDTADAPRAPHGPAGTRWFGALPA